MITYERLWETMKKRGITQYHLIKHEKFSAGQIGRLKNNLTVSTQTLDTLCRLLSCRIEDIVTYIPDNGEPLPEPDPALNLTDETISPNTDETATDPDMDAFKEKKVPNLYGKAKKGIKISKKSSKKASKGDKGEKSEKSDKAEKGEKKAKKKNKDKDKDKDKKTGD